jgi:hypothetical protein
MANIALRNAKLGSDFRLRASALAEFRINSEHLPLGQHVGWAVDALYGRPMLGLVGEIAGMRIPAQVIEAVVGPRTVVMAANVESGLRLPQECQRNEPMDPLRIDPHITPKSDRPVPVSIQTPCKEAWR